MDDFKKVAATVKALQNQKVLKKTYKNEPGYSPKTDKVHYRRPNPDFVPSVLRKSPSHYRMIVKMSEINGVDALTLRGHYFKLDVMTIDQFVKLFKTTRRKAESLVTDVVVANEVQSQSELNTVYCFRILDSHNKGVKGTGILMVRIDGKFWSFMRKWVRKKRK